MKLLCITMGLDGLGGTNALGAYALQALRGRHEVDLLTWEPQNPARIRHLYGVDVQVGLWLSVPDLWRRAVAALPIPHNLVRLHVLMRRARQLAPAYDLSFSLHNEVGFDHPSLQYVHFPWSFWPRPDAPRGWNENPLTARLLRVYYRLCQSLSGYRADVARDNVTLVNSAWSEQRWFACGGRRSRVVYPPVLDAPPGKDWRDRENALVCLGRLDPEKKIDRAVRIARAAGLDLHLVGRFGSPDYRRKILAQAHSGVHLHEGLGRDDVMALLGSVRYGLHCMVDEHFGMAVAEMACCGCLPFVHDSGGPPEIVREPALRYRDEAEAVRKIGAVAGSPAEQERLRQALDDSRERFSYAAFEREILNGVARASERATPAASPPGPAAKASG